MSQTEFNPTSFEEKLSTLSPHKRKLLDLEATRRRDNYLGIILPRVRSFTTITTTEQAKTVTGLEIGYLYFASALRKVNLQEGTESNSQVRLPAIEKVLAISRPLLLEMINQGSFIGVRKRWETKIREHEEKRKQAQQAPQQEKPTPQPKAKGALGWLRRSHDALDDVLQRSQRGVTRQERTILSGPNTQVTRDILILIPDQGKPYNPFNVELTELGLPFEDPITNLV